MDGYELISRVAVGKITGQTPRHLWQLFKEGRGIPVVVIGRAHKYRLADVQAYIDRHRVPTKDE